MPRRGRPALAVPPGLPLTLALALVACRDSPPTELAGFRLSMSQEQVVLETRRRGDAACHLTGTRPPVAICEGRRAGDEFRVVVVGDTTASIRAPVPARGRRPHRDVGRFVRRFGEPAWRDRPYHPPSEPTPGFHTLWLTRDTTRSLAMICASRALGPPCAAELARTSPAAIEAKLDSILNIRR
jgi:hypothetical protein